MTLSGGQLTLLRSPNQWSELFMIVRKPNTIFTGRLDTLPGSNDSVVQITYVSGSGYANVKAGMTLLVGTTAGASDLGIARVRKAPTSTIIYIGEQSEIHWSASCYLTINDNFLPWAKVPRIIDINNAVWDKDYDVAYSDQHLNWNPVPIMGTARVVQLVAATVDVAFDASASYVIGSTISGHSWSAPGSSASSGMATATPTITYNAVGSYCVYDTVTATNGSTSTGVRYVFVWSLASPPITTFSLSNYHGSRSNGEWDASISAHGEMAIANVEPNAYAILFAIDHFDSVINTCPGEVVGAENVLLCGWISDENITFNVQESSVDFQLHNITNWLHKLPSFPLYIEIKTSGNPTAWTNATNLTVDKMLFDCLYWHSTVMQITDCFLTGDTKLVTYFREQIGDFYTQLDNIAYTTIYAKIGTDKYGRVFFETEPQLIPLASRSGISTLWTLDHQDWHDETQFSFVETPNSSMVNLGGVITHNDGSDATPILSNAPGSVMGHWGSIDSADSLVVSTQAQANELAGLIYAWKNNPFPQMVLHMTGNVRVLDLHPIRRIQLTIDHTETVRDIPMSGYLFITDISMSLSEGGFPQYDVTYEMWTAASQDGLTVPVPPVPPTPEIPIPPIPSWPWPGSMLSRTFTWIIGVPSVGGMPGPRIARASLIKRIDAYVVNGTSVSFNIEERTTIGQVGTDVTATDMVAPTTGTYNDTPVHGTLTEGNWLWLDISAVAGGPTYLVITLTTWV